MHHFILLTEDISGKKMLDILLPKLLPGGSGATYEVKAYKGVGNIPPKGKADPGTIRARQLLNNLERLLRGYGKTFSSIQEDYHVMIVVVCDLDKRDKAGFLGELNAILAACNPAPATRFCLAIEEGEAWLLGDIPAIIKAYPGCNRQILAEYVNDSICGTWELLADALHKNGAAALKKDGFAAVGKAKSEWAEQISPHMDVETNKSPSFCHFRDTLRECLQGA